MMQRTDLLLKIITAANGEKVTPVQLQKVAFLLGMKFPKELPVNYYKFQKYDYGPFCVDVYRDAETLQRNGLILISENPRGGWKEYSALRHTAINDLGRIPKHIANYIDETVQWARTLSFQELVREVYIQFPQYRENSVFQG